MPDSIESFDGAICRSCPLGCGLHSSGERFPVTAEKHPEDRIVILGDFPGTQEVEEIRPFVGPSGIELQQALDLIGVSRTECRLDNVLACRPKGDDLSGYMLRLGRRNRAKVSKGEDPWPTPQNSCRPRLHQNLKQFRHFLCLGATASAALRGGNPSITKLRGSCEKIPAPWDPNTEILVSYTLHPSFVTRFPKWRSTFQHDIAKAARFFQGNLSWKDPDILWSTSVDNLRSHLNELRTAGKPVAYDVETDAKNPLDANLRCLAFSNEDTSVLVPILSIDGSTRAFSPSDEEDVFDILRDFLVNPGVPLTGHNAGQYDRIVCEEQLGVTPTLRADTLLLHLLSNNEMPHNLGFVGSRYTDFTEAWKADHTATQARTDKELHTYCAKDACVTARVVKPLSRVIRRRKQFHLIEREHQLQDIGCRMQRLGMFVDQAKLSEHEFRVQTELEKHKKICLEVGPDEFNPNSTHQLRKILFNEWNLPPVKYNEKSGDPSTDDDSLRRMLTEYGLDEEKNTFIQSIRLFRRNTKLLSTYIRPLRSGFVLSDGRVHPAYNRLPATGRYSSSEPNAQNIPYDLRDIFIPQPGHVFVGADADQLELRYIAEEANAERLIDVINSGLDPHNETMEIIYGKSIWSLDGAPTERTKKGKGTFKATRGVTKNVRYAWQYAASVPKIWEQVVSVEDDEGKLIYAHLTKRDIRDVVRGLERADPEIPKWWQKIRNSYRKIGYVADSLWGRRRDFENEEKLNELVNHPIQTGGAVVVHESMLHLTMGNPGWTTETITSGEVGVIPFDFDRKTGLINQCHDSLLFEVEEKDGEKVKEWLQVAMTRRRRAGARVNYTAEAEIGMNWKEV
jgi:DNA polymerase I-like protein with 3'-5' exonuclease and polymerase domains/uracil-DNA glycosylase